jgi:hypothetical protein
LNDDGVFVAWSEAGDTALPDWAIGRSRIVIVRLEHAFDGAPAWSTIAAPLFDDYGAVELSGRGPTGGLLDRFSIIKRDFTRNVCFRLGLASPTSDWTQVELPAKWALESLTVEPDATKCSWHVGSPGAIEAAGAVGAIDWAGEPPCSIDLSVSLTFPPGAPWVPASELLAAVAVPVLGPPCGG